MSQSRNRGNACCIRLNISIIIFCLQFTLHERRCIHCIAKHETRLQNLRKQKGFSPSTQNLYCGVGMSQFGLRNYLLIVSKMLNDKYKMLHWQDQVTYQTSSRGYFACSKIWEAGAFWALTIFSCKFSSLPSQRTEEKTWSLCCTVIKLWNPCLDR